MPGDLPLAFLAHEATIYFPDASEAFSPAQTPISRLIEGIDSCFPETALSILRERIYTAHPLTSLCEGMIKVAAKRASVLSASEFSAKYAAVKSAFPKICQITQPASPKFHLPGVPDRFSSLEEGSRFCLSLKARSPRAISALVIGPENELISYAWNTHESARTQHAELNLIRALEQRGFTCFPEGARVVTTLKPCAMCAGALFRFSTKTFPVPVYYLEDDPGPKAANSVYVKHSDLWKKAGSPDVQLTQLNPNSMNY